MVNLSVPYKHNPAVRSFYEWHDLELRRRIKRLRTMYGIEDPSIKKKALEADYWACKNDPVYWMENYAWVVNPKDGDEKKREIPLVLFDRQLELVRAMQESIDNQHPLLIAKGRELGISWIALLMCYWGWRFNSGFSAKLGSRKETFVDDGTIDSLFGKIRFTKEKQPYHLTEKNVKDNNLKLVNVRNKSEIVGEATNPGFGRGGRKTVVVLDEYAHVPTAVAASTWTSLNTVSKTIWPLSSVNGRGNKFYELYENLPSEHVFEIDWTANPYRDQAWKENELKSISQEEFEQEHEISFAAVKSGRIFKFNRDVLIYDEYDDRWVPKKERGRNIWQHISGWDFGSGASLTCCLMSVLEWVEGSAFPIIWLDDELVWKSAEWGVVAEDRKDRMQNYGSHFKLDVGDPASKNRESNQSSWAMNLASARIPFMTLPADYNTQKGIDDNIKIVQWFINSDKLRIHKRCETTLQSLESWRYDIPDGVPAEMVSKIWISPRKDGYSHTMNALMYLCGFVSRSMRRGNKEDLSKLSKNSRFSGVQQLRSISRTARNV